MSLETKAAIILAKGFEEVEALTVVDYLRREEIEIQMIALQDRKYITGSHGIQVLCDMSMDELIQHEEEFTAIILPGGMPGAKNLREDEQVLALVKRFDDAGKTVAAICAAPAVLQQAGILQGRKVTSYPSSREEIRDAEYLEDRVVVDRNLITSRAAGTAAEFALELIARFKNRSAAERLAQSILF